MANDITKSKSGESIKNGTIVTTCSFTGSYKTINSYVSNAPIIADIQSKYDERFDDPSYYYGIGNATVVGG
jgi:hypothetical protein